MRSLIFVILSTAIILQRVSASPSLSTLRIRSSDLDYDTAYHDDESLSSTIWDSLTGPSQSEDNYEIEEIGKRAAATCPSDASCGAGYFCSKKSFKCIRQRHQRSKCSRDAVCRSGYCGVRSHRCSRRKGKGANCFGSDSACKSGYCSRKTSKCARKRYNSEKCLSNASCWSENCVDGKCQPSKTTPPNPTHTPDPTGRA